MNDRLTSPETEQAVIGACIRFPAEAIHQLRSGGCCSNWFHGDHCRQMWELIEDKSKSAQPIDATLMETYVREKYGWSAGDLIARCCARVPDLSHIRSYMEVLVEMVMKRDLNSSLQAAVNKLPSDQRAGQIAVTLRSELNTLGVMSGQGGKSALLAELELDLDNPHSVEKEYVRSRLPFIHEHIHGWFRSQPVTIGADPKTGKTTMLLQEIVAQVVAGIPCGVISIEMKAQQILFLCAAILSGVDGFLIRTKQATEEDRALFRKALRFLRDAPLYIRDDVRDANGVIAAYYDLSLTHKCVLVGIDYFQLVSQSKEGGKTGEKNRFEHLTNFSNAIVAGAKELGNVPIVLSQLRKEGNMRGKKVEEDPPTEHDLDGTQALARDSHTVILMSRVRKPDPDPGEHRSEIRFDIRLNRSGKTPEVPLIFIKNQQRFVAKDSYVCG